MTEQKFVASQLTDAFGEMGLAWARLEQAVQDFQLLIAESWEHAPEVEEH